MWQLDRTNCSFLTRNDTFMLPHLTKQPTGSRTDTSLSARCSLFSEIAAPTVIKPGSHFLSLCPSHMCSALWVKMKDTTGTSSDAPPLPTFAGSRKSALHFFFHETTYTSGWAFSSLCESLHPPLTLFHVWTHYVSVQQLCAPKPVLLWRRNVWQRKKKGGGGKFPLMW